MIRTSEIRERITSSKKLKINATVEEEEKKEEEDLYDMDEQTKASKKEDYKCEFKALTYFARSNNFLEKMEFTEDFKTKFSKFFQLYCQKKTREKVLHLFWGQEKKDLEKYFNKEAHLDLLKNEFIEPTAKKVFEERSKMTKFEQLIKFQVINNILEDEEEESKKGKIISAFTPFIASEVSAADDSSSKVLELLSMLTFDELKPMGESFETFKTCIAGCLKQLEE